MKVKAGLLIALGLFQMAGDVFRVPFLKKVGAASAASPAPKVFCAIDGYEAYATRFTLEWVATDGTRHERPLTADAVGRLRGPYNRRNVYGAVLAYGPLLVDDPRTRPMFESAARYALCGEAPVLRELGLDPARVAGRVRLRFEPRAGSDVGSLPLELEPPCR